MVFCIFISFSKSTSQTMALHNARAPNHPQKTFIFVDRHNKKRTAKIHISAVPTATERTASCCSDKGWPFRDAGCCPATRFHPFLSLGGGHWGVTLASGRGGGGGLHRKVGPVVCPTPPKLDDAALEGAHGHQRDGSLPQWPGLAPPTPPPTPALHSAVDRVRIL